jgi:hypothetical protein
MKLPLPLPRPKPTEPVVFLLYPEQIAWIRSHAAGNASSFMRRLLEQLMEEERKELEAVQQQLRERQMAS